jgi:LuxR family maltose regulon positive regulatory protein
MQDADPLIHTKLRFLFVHPDQVPRPRLQELIAQGLRGPLTLVIAPAGYGKTSLVSSAIASLQIPTAWLSLDQDDNRAGRFLQYVIAGLRDLDPSIGVEASGLMAAPEQAPRDVVLTSLINDMEAVGRDIAVVLDDYQFIASQTVHEAVTFLVEHGPSSLHLLIAKFEGGYHGTHDLLAVSIGRAAPWLDTWRKRPTGS